MKASAHYHWLQSHSAYLAAQLPHCVLYAWGVRVLWGFCNKRASVLHIDVICVYMFNQCGIFLCMVYWMLKHSQYCVVCDNIIATLFYFLYAKAVTYSTDVSSYVITVGIYMHTHMKIQLHNVHT